MTKGANSSSVDPGPFAPRRNDCPICAGTALKHDFAQQSPVGGHLLNWSRCVACGFAFMNPRLVLEEMRKLYDSSNYWNDWSYVDYLENEAVRLENCRRRFRSLRGFIPETGALLDIGCATGTFAAVASQNGYRVVGIDPSAEMIEHGRKTYGINLLRQTIEEADFVPGSFDVISLLGTDSHFFDVRASFERLVSWLKPAGVFIFTYQDYGHWIRWFFPRIKQCPNVYSNFTRRSLGLFFSQLSLEIVSEKTAVQVTQLHRVFRTMQVGKRLFAPLNQTRVTIPTISFMSVLARRVP